MKLLENTISKIENVDISLFEQAQEHLDNLTKPRGSLGRLEDLAKQIAGITKNIKPNLANKVIFTLAADHGVADEGVSAFPKEVTVQMVYNFLNGGAGINVLAKYIGAKVVVVDMGVAEKIKEQGLEKNNALINFIDKKINFGTKNMTKEAAMTKEEAIRAIEAGIECVMEEYSRGIDIIGTGDMGIANTTASSAIAAVITNSSVEVVTGRGTGIDDNTFIHKVDIIKKALAHNRPDPNDPIDIVSKVGGFEIAGLAGIILASAAKKIPVVIDGFISGAAALIACKLEPKTKDYMIAAHCSVEEGHRIILKHLGIQPILDLRLRLGEGTGAALAISVVEAGTRILNEMATFKKAGVTEKINQ